MFDPCPANVAPQDPRASVSDGALAQHLRSFMLLCAGRSAVRGGRPRPLLGAAGVHLDAPAPADSPYRGTWTDLLGRPPFYGFAAYQHRGHCLAHALLADGYAASIASLWRAPPPPPHRQIGPFGGFGESLSSPLSF